MEVLDSTYGIRKIFFSTYGNQKTSAICMKNMFSNSIFVSKRLKMHYNLVFRAQNTQKIRLRRANWICVHFVEAISAGLIFLVLMEKHEK